MGMVEGLAPQTAEESPGETGRKRNGRLLRLAASCPNCGSRPALRITEDAVRAVMHHPPDERLGTYQCHRRRCEAIYDLTAAAYQNAS